MIQSYVCCEGRVFVEWSRGGRHGTRGWRGSWLRPRPPAALPLPLEAGAVTCTPPQTRAHSGRDRHRAGTGWGSETCSCPALPLRGGLPAEQPGPRPSTPKANFSVALARGSQAQPQLLFLPAVGAGLAWSRHLGLKQKNLPTDKLLYKRYCIYSDFFPFCPQPSFAACCGLCPSMI